jgi:hypothetical protein
MESWNNFRWRWGIEALFTTDGVIDLWVVATPFIYREEVTT